MHPTLFHIGGFAIHTYGFFVAMGFLLGISLAVREARRVDENPEKIMDTTLYGLIAALVGSRLFYVAINWNEFRYDPLEIIRIWRGGLVFYGGLIAAFFVVLWYIRKNRLSLWKTADILAPSIALGQSIGRIGCFFAGCCYGKACDHWWGVIFTNPESLAPKGVSLHPTQLYSSLNAFLIFVVLFQLRKRKKFEGELFWLYVLLYSISRSVIEVFRGDPRGFMFGGVLSVSQMIGIVMACAALFMLYRLNTSSCSK
ncbi:MAG: prolipoprotein diacylglyceryl transferase [Deltaproteobacteria bacterium]|jgi:phosphatidylglycerol:prolipoprotein diacylglycerol transferase|nr:prolipoprotein diacylglyceryl transferase [Deltaproteobacteria bacterium]